MTKIPVYYLPAQVSKPDSFSPSPGKPADVVADWLAHGFPIEVIAPAAVSRETLALAHDRAYVDGVLDLKRPNGFASFDAKVAASLPYTSGSMLAAARAALANRRVAVSPTSGFHHASYTRGAGYCTFNGLMVAARALLGEGLAKKVGILDCDQHFGDGTEDIIEHFQLREVIHHITAGQGYRRDARELLAALPAILSGFRGCDVILYQAGADPHLDDPLGGYLSTAELLERDRLVFRHAAALGLPVAWNLAGGYQTPLARVLEIHTNTMRACVDVYLKNSKH